MSKKLRVVLVAGDKGGTGKSLIASIYADRLIEESKPLILVETDQRNPDFARRFECLPDVRREYIPMTHDGMLDLLNVLAEAGQTTVIVNTPAACGDILARKHDALAEAMDELKAALCVLWPLDRQKDSVNLLRIFLELYAGDLDRLVVVKNGFFGDPARFDRWQESQTRTNLLKLRGAREAYLPELNPRILDQVCDRPFYLSAANGSLPLGDRLEYRAWLRASRSIFDTLEN